MSDIAERYQRNGFTVTISYDPDCPSPRDDESPGARLALFHRRYTFPDDAGLDRDNYESWADMAAHLRSDHGALYLMAVYMIDHSGLAFRTVEPDAGNPFFEDPGQWDSGIVGFGYVTAETWKETDGTEWAGSEEQLARARQLIRSDVEQYGMYVNGECYSYVITDEYGEQVDDGCCNGIIGMEWVTEEANMDADNREHVTKCNGRLDRAAGTIVHAGPCPLHP